MLELRTLGSLSLTASEPSESPAGAPQRLRLVLLAAIACAGERGIGRDRLHALFWPESDTERARGALNQALYALRRDLGEPELFQGTTDLRVNAAAVRCDVVEFERAVASGRLEEASALYGGAFLDGVFARSPDLEQWIEAERHRLAQLHASVLEQLAADAEERGNAETAVAAWRRLCAADPLSARYAIGLMRVLAAAGDREAAIRCADAHALRVREELDATPDPQVAGLADALRRGEGVVGGREGPSAPIAPAAVAPNVAEDGQPAMFAASPLPARTSRYRRIALGLMVLTALAVWPSYRGLRGVFDASSADETGPVVAVLPFTSLGGDRSDSLFAAGMHTEIQTQLYKLGSIIVIGPMSASLHAAAENSPVEIASKLGADALLVGSMGRANERFRLRVQLVDGETGRTLWADAYDDSVTVDRLLDVQEEVALRIAAGLEVVLTEDERQRLAERPEPTLEAYEYFVVGETHFRNGRWGEALAYFDSAVAADPNYALAQAAVAKAASMSYFMAARDNARELALEALRHARGMAPSAPETHMADGFVNLLVIGDYEAAINSFNIAMRFFPNNAELVFWCGVAYTLPLRLDSAAALNRRAYRRDFDHAQIIWQTGGIAAVQWKFREASRHLERAFERAPAHQLIFHQRWLVHMWGLGDTARARTLLEEAGPAIARNQLVEKWAWQAYVARSPAALAAIVDSMDAWPELRYLWRARLAILTGDERGRRVYGDSITVLNRSELQRAREAGITPRRLAALTAELAAGEALSGDRKQALETVKNAVRLAERQPDRLNTDETYLAEAVTYAYLDMPEIGVQRLDSVFAHRKPFYLTPIRLRLDPDFDSFRRSPQFEAFLAKYDRMVER